MRALRPLVAAILLLGLAACETIPRPFKHDDAGISALARPKLGRGIALRVPDELPGGQALAEAAIAAFEVAEVPVTLRHGPGFGRVIEVQPGDADRLTWRLLDADGTEMGRLSTQAGTPAKFVAQQVVGRFLPLLDDPDARPQLAAAQLPPPLAVRLAPMKGLPGDGDQALPRSLTKALERHGIGFADDAAYTVVGVVAIAQIGAVEDQVTVSWLIKRGDEKGPQLARIDQGGSVPRGRLTLPWGSLARDIAEGGAASISEVVRSDDRNRKDQEKAGGSRRFTETGAADIGKPDSSEETKPVRAEPPQPPSEPPPVTEAVAPQAPPPTSVARSAKVEKAKPKPVKSSAKKTSPSPAKAKKAKLASKTKPTGTRP